MEKLLEQQEYNIVLIGRPNVGKSSVFNFLVNITEAYVKDEEGTTLDWRSKKVDNIRFWDTPGVFDVKHLPPCEIHEVFFVVENNILNIDKQLFLLLKRKFKNIFVLVNKVDKGVEDYSFFGDCLEISVTSRYNLRKLVDHVNKNKKNEEEVDKKIWAILGRPNVGKSTLVNKFLNKDLHKVEDKEGTTKEFLPVDFDEKVLLDTPGQRRRAKFPHYSNVFGVMFVTDLRNEKHDYKVINMLIKRNKPVFVVLNKIDLEKNNEIKTIEAKFKKFFDIPILKISCQKGTGIKNVQKQIDIMEANYSKRINTSVLNEWLTREVKRVEPRVKFITQVATSFPKFFVDYQLETHKEKMLKRKLMRDFGFLGIPVEIKYNK